MEYVALGRDSAREAGGTRKIIQQAFCFIQKPLIIGSRPVGLLFRGSLMKVGNILACLLILFSQEEV